MRMTSIVILVLALGGCHASKKDATESRKLQPKTINYAETVLALPKGQREAVLFRAVRDAGLSCQFITKVEQIKAIRGNLTWRAQCDGKTSHLIQIMPNGVANVVSPTAP